MKKLFTALLVLTMSSFVLSSTHADSIPDEQISAPTPPPGVGGYTGLYLDDTTNFTGFASYLVGIAHVNHNPNGAESQAWICTSLNDSNCAQADSFNFNAYLNPCVNSNDVNCLEGISATSVDGSTEEATLVRSYPEKFPTSFVGNVTQNLPNGGSPSLWKFQSTKHSGGELFLATPNVTSFNWIATNGSAQPQLGGGIYAVSLTNNGSVAVPSVHVGGASAFGYTVGGNETTPDCAMADGLTCAKIYPLPLGVRFSMQLRLALPISGFLHGRLQDPVITILKDGAITHLKLAANPTAVPVFGYWGKNTDLPAALNAIIDSHQMGGRFYFSDGSGTRAGTALLEDGRNTGYSVNSIKEFALWLPLANDQAIATKTVWGFHTLVNYDYRLQKCINSKSDLQGIVTTNATMYEDNPPSYDANSGTLRYQVASPHFDKNKNVNIGNYSLVLNAATARCIYDFTAAPIRAAVSVVSSDGTSQVASVVMNESDGWLTLNAAGFTFSSPTISVKLTQEKALASPATPEGVELVTSVTKATTPKKIMVTCVKGKITKKVIALKPTCPSGYKRK